MDYISVLRFMVAASINDNELRRIVDVCSQRDNGGYLDLFDDVHALRQVFTGVAGKVIEKAVSDVDNQGVMDIYERLKSSGCVMITEYDELYPEKFRTVLGANRPPVLFARGNLQLLKSKCIGFTGSRHISERGKLIARNSARLLAQNGVTVVSGYARGSDEAVHTEAMKYEGNTIFMLVEGILSFRKNEDIEHHTDDGNHLYLSRVSPISGWLGSNALLRNEMIIAISKAVILTEASTIRSGTYSTGCRTMKYSVPLFVLEYQAPPPSASMNRYLIERGAIPLRGSRDGVPNMRGVMACAMK